MKRLLTRVLAAAAIGAPALLLASTASAATTGDMTLSGGQISTPLTLTANSTASFTVKGAVGFSVLRSEDSGATFQPLARDTTGALAHFVGPVTIDLTEARSGVSYAIQGDPAAQTFVARIDQ